MNLRQLSKRLVLTRPYSTKTTQKAIFLNQEQLQSLGVEESELFVEEIPIGSEHIVRGSEEACFGSKRIGCVELPKPLVNGIAQLIEGQDKRLVRTDALRLYDALRSTARIPKESTEEFDGSRASKKNRKAASAVQQQVEPHKLSYGPRESVAYAAGVLPSTYAAVANVMNELSKRLSHFKPRTLLDFGTGPGTAIWAAKETFQFEKCTGVDLSEDMLRVAEELEGFLQTTLDATPVEFKRYLAMDPKAPKTDLVISSFTLGDISSTALQKSTVEQLWQQTGDILVLIDRGTPIGFSNIARARQWVLDSDDDVHVVAPCSHDKPCPLLYSPQAKPDDLWCHFSQRVQRPTFLMKTKHSKFNTEDSKYAYVVLRRGVRPQSSTTLESQAYHWPRLIQPPLKKNGHVVLDTCSTTGEIQRMVVPKSQGKVPYRDARKAMWGDLFPHGSKNKIVTRVSQGVAGGDL